MIPAPAALSLPLRSARAARRVPVVPEPAGPMRNDGPRFTVDGGPELEAHLARTCARIAAGLRGLLPPAKLEAVLLGGGYGRGEGGVLRTAAGDRPYNDLEFYVCLRGNRHWNERRYGRRLHVLGEILTPQAGVDVEFKITSRRELSAGAITMFSHDLIAGHRWLVGREEMLEACAHHRDAAQIPLAEATRLLMNRASGLLLAEERLQRNPFTPADSDFIRRNLAKAQLALGDAVLVSYGQYHDRARERHRRLERIARLEGEAWFLELAGHHASGLEFKLHPERSTETRDVLRPDYFSVSMLALRTWLWLESRRLGVAFRSAREYADHPWPLWSGGSTGRNVLLNAKVFGARGLGGSHLLRHPRDHILRALTLLLWEPAAGTSPVLRTRLRHALRTEADDFRGLVASYRERWAKVN